MARAKGMLNLSGNLEVNAQAPLDARTIVPTEADLTVANNFPYPYVGLEVYVTGTGKKFRLINLDTTQSSSWQEIGEGGGGETYSDFTGATESTAGAHGLVPAPSAGDEGKVLFGNGSWGNIVMPSVDYSQQSVEANIFDTTEKVIGQWTDGKLLYQKCLIPENDERGLDANQWNIVLNNAFGVGVVDKVITIRGVIYNGSKNQVFEQPDATSRYEYHKENDQIFVWVASDWAHRPDFILIQYTKTTDSPLASDEKFAGLTASGEVIYKRVFELSPSSQAQSQTWTEIDDIDCQSIGVDKIINGQVLDDHTYYPMALDYKPSASTKLRIMNFRNVDVKIIAIILYYTKTS